MKAPYSSLIALCALPLITACGDADGKPSDAVNVAIAPLDLPGLFEVCYGLSVYNGDPADVGTDVVWSEGELCSGLYGNDDGGGITYIGPCDASADGNNYVELVLETVEVQPGGVYLDDQLTTRDGDADFVNPCTASEPCVLDFECVENGDVTVEFNLTVMRDANQGWFDIAVNFEDVFCSMKLDSCYEDGEGDEIALLFGDGKGEDGVVDGEGRDHTAVFAMACTAGPGADIATEILLGQVTIGCDFGSFTLPIGGLDQGNNMVKVDLDGDDDASHAIQYGLYYGKEGLDCGPLMGETAISCNKAYLNFALDLEDLPAGCTLSFEATAQDANDPVIDGSGVIAGSGMTYPYVQVAAAELDGCYAWAAGEEGGPLQVVYGTSPDLGPTRAPPVMCLSSLAGGMPRPLPETAKNGLEQYATIATAEKVDFERFGRFPRYLAMVRNPCDGKLAEPRRVQESQFIASVATIRSNRFTFTGRKLEAPGSVVAQFDKSEVTYHLGASDDVHSFEITKLGTKELDAYIAKGQVFESELLTSAVREVYLGVVVAKADTTRLGEVIMASGETKGFALDIGVRFNR